MISRPTFLATLIVTVATVTSVSASSLIVPDDSPTIQGALNALPDTVFVRSGNYSETPVLFAQVALLGIPGDPALERPILAGLTLLSSPQDFPLLLVRGFQIASRVNIQNGDFLTYIRLEQCQLLAGISDISAFPATAGITLRRCTIEQDAFLKADGQCVVDSCVFKGGQLIVGQENCELTVTNSTFHGLGRGIAISTIGFGSDVLMATISRNVIEGYFFGMQMNAILSVRMENNSVRDIQAGAIYALADDVQLVQNRVERCGGSYGIVAECNADLLFANNVVANCSESGVLAIVGTGGIVEGNVIWGNGLEGLYLGANPVSGVLNVNNNTSCLNGRSGFLSECPVGPHARYAFTRNIGFGNGGNGVNWGVPEVSIVSCNDWFANGLGAVSGLPLPAGDFTTDPLFCSPINGDFRLFAGSPFVDRAGCGRVGALDVGCDITATLVRQFTAEWVKEGIRIVWELTESSIPAIARLERAEAGEQGPWTPIATEIGHDGSAVVELDRSVVAERPYWYRLAASVSGSTRIIGAPILVPPRNSPSFRLALVGPTPTRGPVQIEFELREAAPIELTVFDLQGRIVATPARGVWPAGKHAVKWPSSSGMALCPAGVYLVRYQYPGGEYRRRVIRTP